LTTTKSHWMDNPFEVITNLGTFNVHPTFSVGSGVCKVVTKYGCLKMQGMKLLPISCNTNKTYPEVFVGYSGMYCKVFKYTIQLAGAAGTPHILQLRLSSRCLASSWLGYTANSGRSPSKVSITMSCKSHTLKWPPDIFRMSI